MDKSLISVTWMSKTCTDTQNTLAILLYTVQAEANKCSWKKLTISDHCLWYEETEGPIMITCSIKWQYEGRLATGIETIHMSSVTECAA
jgi:hypothetical protein